VKWRNKYKTTEDTEVCSVVAFDGTSENKWRSIMTMKIIVTALLFMNSIVFSQEVHKFTLNDCIKKALENNQNIKSTEYDVISARYKAASAKANFLPVFDISGNYMRLSEIDPFSITLPTGNAIDIFPMIFNNYGINVSFKQPLFTGARIKSIYDIAKSTHNSKQEILEEVKNSVTYSVSDLYWKLVFAIESKKVIEESVLLLQSHLNDVKNLQQNGMASENDVKKVEVRLSNMELMQTTIKKNIELTKAILCKSMNIPLDTRFEPEYELPSLEFNLNFKEIISKAGDKNPLIKSFEFGLEAAEAAVKIMRSQFFPSVYMVGTYNYAQPNTRILPLQDKWADTWNAGIVVQFTLWNWGRKRAEYQASQNDFLKAQTDYENLCNQLELDIKRIFLEIEESLKKYQVSRKMVEQAEENYRISREKYRNGMLLNADLLDAEVDLLKSRLEVTKSITDFTIKMAELKKVAGLNE